MGLLRSLLILVVMTGIGLSSMPVEADTRAGTSCMQSVSDQVRGCGGGMMGSDCAMSTSCCTPPAITGTPGLLAATPARFDLTAWATASFSSLMLPPDTAPPKHPFV
jgi:hypothetical protein